MICMLFYKLYTDHNLGILQKGTVSGGSFLEEFLISVIELGENNGTVPDVVEEILDFDQRWTK